VLPFQMETHAIASPHARACDPRGRGPGSEHLGGGAVTASRFSGRATTQARRKRGSAVLANESLSSGRAKRGRVTHLHRAIHRDAGFQKTGKQNERKSGGHSRTRRGDDLGKGVNTRPIRDHPGSLVTAGQRVFTHLEATALEQVGHLRLRRGWSIATCCRRSSTAVCHVQPILS